MQQAKLYQVLLFISFGFGVAATVLCSWQAACMALVGTAAALVEMHMLRTVFETRLLEMQADFKNSVAELGDELSKLKNDIVRLNNKNGLR